MPHLMLMYPVEEKELSRSPCDRLQGGETKSSQRQYDSRGIRIIQLPV